MSKKIKRILELEAQIKYHDYLYTEKDAPVISDAAYDELVREYWELIEDTPEYQTTLRVGFVAPDPTMELVKIEEPMLSVKKRKDRDEFEKWIKTNIQSGATYEEKLDGVALRIIYINGDLHRIHTRGDGSNGADLSHRRHLLLNVPDRIENDVGKDRTEYTGEAFCKYADFDAYVERHGLDPENTDPRSTVSGLMKRHKSTDRDDLPIYFKVYSACKKVRSEFETYPELIEYLASVGFDIPMKYDGALLNEMLSLPQKPKDAYPIDGIVAKDNDLRKWDLPQETEYWTYAVCYKFPSMSIDTEVIGIDWSLTMVGQLVGTVLYKPVNYEGTVLTRAKLYYPQTYFDKGLGVGAVIKITKSNEIIPHVVGLVTPSPTGRFKYPDQCPFCDEMVTLDQEAGTAFCNNEACAGQLLRQLIRLTDRKDGLDIKGLGDKRIQALLDNGFLSNAYELFDLTEEDLINSGIDLLTAGKIIDQIAHLNDHDLYRWLSALAIPGLGPTRAIEISNLASTNGMVEGTKFYDLASLMLFLTDASFLQEMFGLDGLVIGGYIRQHQEEITKFLKHYDFTKPRSPSLDGIPVSITGSWNALTRPLLSNGLAEHGFLLSDKVCKTTKVLMVGQKPSAAKIEKAKKWNIPVVEINSLYDLNSIVALISSK